MFPLRDSIRARTPPVVNITIVIVCSVVFVYELLLGPRLPELFQVAGFIPGRLFDVGPAWTVPAPNYGVLGNLATVLASMFLHGGWLHVIGNLWFLWVFGDNIEDTLGHGRYLVFYLVGGVVASLAHAVTAPSSAVPTIGASGAIAAVLGAYTVWFHRARVRALIFLGFFITTAELPAVVFLGFWFLIQFFQGTLSLGLPDAAAGVAWFAHIGGFLFGAGVAFWLRASGKLPRLQRPPVVWQRFDRW